MNIGQRIKAARTAKGLSQKALADLIGKTASTVSSWENDGVSPRRAILKEVSKVLDVEIRLLEFGEDIDSWEGPPAEHRMVQVIGYIGAGGTINPIDDHAMGGGLEEVECAPDAKSGTVAVIVRGDSMYPLLTDGSLIFYSNRGTDFENHLHRLVVAHFKDGRKAVKGLTPGSHSGVFTLTSINKSPMIDVELDSVSSIDWIKPI